MTGNGSATLCNLVHGKWMIRYRELGMVSHLQKVFTYFRLVCNVVGL